MDRPSHHPYPDTPSQQQTSQSLQISYQPDSNNAEKFSSPQEEYSGTDSGQDGQNGQNEQDGSRKRPRHRPMSVSCELCKIRKVKCDRGQPSCGWCHRNGQICEYKERKKPGLRAGYGRELEQRMDALEQIVQAQGRVIEALQSGTTVMPTSSTEDGRMYSSTSLQQSPTHAARAKSSNFVPGPQLYPASEQLARSGMMAYHDSTKDSTPQLQSNGSYNRTQGKDSGLKQLQEAVEAQTQQAFYSNSNPALEPSTMSISSGHRIQSIPRQGAHNSPPYDLLYSLTGLFFTHIDPWCPILLRRTTFDTLFGSTELEEDDRILLHAIVATTLRFSKDKRLNEQNRALYHNFSKETVLLYGIEKSSVKVLQALVILALDFVGTSNGPPGWNLLAVITRSVAILGLAVEATSSLACQDYPSIHTLRAMVLPEARGWIEDESRRRLFWMIYVLDRYATVATAFDFALDEREISRKLPCRDDLFTGNMPVETKWFGKSDRLDYPIGSETLGSFSYHIEILGVLTKIHLFLKKRVDISSISDVEEWQNTYRDLDEKLRQSQSGLPPEYGNISSLFNSHGNTRSFNCGWIMLRAASAFASIRLHSSAAYPAHVSPIFTPSMSAAQRCYGAAEEIVALGQYVVHNVMLNQFGPPFAFLLWVAARVLLVHGSTMEQQLNPAIQFLIDTLRDMGISWEVADRYYTLLQRVVDEWRESESSLDANGQCTAPSSVKILADMRRCAYDLDVLVSRQPRRQASSSMIPGPTSARNRLDYVEAFDFFNVPRLPVTSTIALSGSIDPSLQVADGNNANIQFNMANFPVDASSDWLFKNTT